MVVVQEFVNCALGNLWFQFLMNSSYTGVIIIYGFLTSVQTITKVHKLNLVQCSKEDWQKHNAYVEDIFLISNKLNK